jgi:hypothetical protein
MLDATPLPQSQSEIETLRDYIRLCRARLKILGEHKQTDKLMIKALDEFVRAGMQLQNWRKRGVSGAKPVSAMDRAFEDLAVALRSQMAKVRGASVGSAKRKEMEDVDGKEEEERWRSFVEGMAGREGMEVDVSELEEVVGKVEEAVEEVERAAKRGRVELEENSEVDEKMKVDAKKEADEEMG